MKEFILFTTGIVLTLIFSLISVAYLRHHLKNILVELCGKDTRADFWMAFSNIALVITPVIFATFIVPEYSKEMSSFFKMIEQLRWALIGLIGTLLILGYTLSRFINFQEPDSPNSIKA